MRQERSLTPSQWQQLKEIFREIVDLAPVAREPLIAERCAGDTDLEYELRQVLRGAEATGAGTSALGSAMDALLSPPEDDLTGRVFGEHRLKRRLDAGGMGVVYLAERQGVGGDVAVKVLLDERMRERFFAEQRLHARLVHSGIPQFHNSGEQDGFSYFVLEYVEGAWITEYCEARRSSLQERLSLFRAVCEAAAFAHQVGVLHCDIKPSNILVKADGSVRLLDFGVATPLGSLAERLEPGRAREHARDHAREHAPEHAVPIGLTPQYAAPEQLRGAAISFAADVHALGVVLYELLTLRHPYVDRSEELSRAELVRRICEDQPIAASRAAEQTGATRVLGKVLAEHWIDLDALVARALEKDPQRRFSTVEALLGELKRFDLKRARDAATAEAIRATRVQQFMVDLMSGGQGGEGHRKGMLVEDLLHAAVRAAEATTTDPVFQAEVLLNAGSSFTALGLLDRAAEPLERALALHERALGPETPEVARDYLALGRLHLVRGDYKDAERDAKTALELGARVAAHDYSLRASAATLLGDVLNVSGRHEEAVSVLQTALASLTHAERDPLVESKLITELANAHYYLGQYEPCKRYNLQSLELDRKHLSPTHSRIADTLINLAAIAMDQGGYEDAERLNREALEITQRFHGEDHPKTASATTIWARSLNMLKRYPEAEEALQRAVVLNARFYPKIHSKVASTLHDLFTAANMQGHTESAQAYAEELVSMERALHGEDHPRMGHALDRLGSVRLEQKDYASAETAFRSSLGIYLKTLPHDHMSVAIAQLKIGRTLTRAGRPSEGAPLSLKGHDMLAPRSPPPRMWLAAAAKDLIQAYDALGQATQAAFFRARLAEYETDS